MATATVLNEGIGEGMKVQVSKVIRAKRERVWAAWTQPEMIRSWFGSDRMLASGATVDLRVGGAYRIEMERTQGDGPATSVSSGVYTEIVPEERLRFTWNGTWSPGEETEVTVLLREVPGGTEVTVMHERFQSAESMKGHEMGWIGGLGNMATVLEG